METWASWAVKRPPERMNVMSLGLRRGTNMHKHYYIAIMKNLTHIYIHLNHSTSTHNK